MRPNAWKPLLPQSRMRWWLVFRLLPISVLLTALVLFLYLVTQPLFHPHVYLLFAAAHYQDGRLDCSSPAEDLEAIHVAPLALLGVPKGKEGGAAQSFANPAALSAALDRLDRGKVRSGDVLIVWLGGELVSRDGQLGLLCENFDSSDLQSCCLPLAQVFDRVRASPATTKLLVLDTGRVSHLPRLGIVAAATSEQIEQIVAKDRDPGLWVVLAHRELERSHVLAGSRRSVLAHFSSEALHGAADANADRYVDVGEFYRYVRDRVSAFVSEETRGRDAQTPRLLWGGGAWNAQTSFPILMPVKPPARSVESEAAGEEVAKEGGKEEEAKESESKGGESKEGESKEGENKETAGKDTASKDGKDAKQEKSEPPPHLDPPPAALLAQRAPGAAIDGSAGLPNIAASAAPAAPENPAEAKAKASSEAGHSGVTSAADAVLTAGPAELSAMAWSLHDRLAASARLRPISTAPQLWRAFEDVLVAHEFAMQAGDVQRLAVLTPELRRLVRQAGDLADGRMPQRYRPRDLLPDLALAAAGPESSAPAHSLAMAQRLVFDGGPSLSKDLAAAVERLDRALAAPDKTELQKLVKELPAGADKWIEFRLARTLAARDDIPWDQIKLALSVRRAAETVAAATLDGGSWARLSVERADALRHRGQQLALEPVRPGDAETGATLLREALAEYENAAAWNEDAIALQETIDAALFDLSDHLRWSIVALAASPDEGPEDELLERLVADLRQAIEIVDSPSPAGLPAVRRMRLQLEDTMAKLRQTVDHSLGLPPTMAAGAGPNAAWTSASAPSPSEALTGPLYAGPSYKAFGAPFFAGLAASDMRRRLLALSIGMPPAEVAKAAQPESIEVRDPLRRLEPAAACFAAAMTLFDDVETKQRALPSEHGLAAVVGLGDSVRGMMQGLPREIQRITVENQDLSKPSQRQGKLRRLQAARRMLNLVDPWDVERLEGPAPSMLLRRARLYDLLVWQQQRLTAEAVAAPPSERGDLLALAETCGRAAAAIPQQPPVGSPAAPGVALSAVAQIDLAEKAEKDVLLTLVNSDQVRQSVWLTADYDPAVLELSSPENGRTSIDDAAATQRSRAGRPGPMSVPLANPQTTAQSSPYLQVDRSLLASREPACVLAVGESRGVWVRLRRKTLAGGDARVIFRAIAAPATAAASGKAPAAGDASAAPTSFRHDLLVALPRRLAVDLVAEGIDDTWQPSETGLLLYPFPNHTTDYRFSLVNTSAVQREVSLDIYRTETPSAAVPPRGDVPASIADEYLARVGGTSLVAHVDKIALPATGERVAVPFPPPGEQAKPSGKPPASAEPPPPPPLSPVLAVVITDRASGRRAVKTIEILTQRPARYLRARAEYDPLRRRLDIAFRPVKPGALPAGGVRIVAAPRVQEAAELYHADASLRGGEGETSLHVEVPRDMTDIYPVAIEVDGFARAFYYRVPTRANSTVTVPEVSRAAIRIMKPKAGTLYGPQATDVPIDLEVDVPHGLLLDNSSCVEVGIDTNRDRLLEHEETVRLTSDRQVDLTAAEIGPHGKFAVGTKVKDLKIKLQPPARRALRANLLARILLPTSVVWSEPVEVIFDDLPPRLSHLAFEPGERVTEGEDLLVSVLANDNELSGVAKVEAAFDPQRKGEFGAVPPVAGFMQTDGRWVVTLSTKPLKPGMYTVLVRATDRCDNASDYLKATVEIVPKTIASAQPKPQLGQITGRVVYGKFEKRPVPGALVQLTATAATGPPQREATTDDNGDFRFNDVPPGDYKLASEKLLGGNRRSGHAEAKVPPPPQATPAVEISLETAKR